MNMHFYIKINNMFYMILLLDSVLIVIDIRSRIHVNLCMVFNNEDIYGEWSDFIIVKENNLNRSFDGIF